MRRSSFRVGLTRGLVGSDAGSVGLKVGVRSVVVCVAAAGCGSGSSIPRTCQPTAIAAQGAGVCNNLLNIASPVRAVLHPGDTVSVSGTVTLIDGLYTATALDGYRGAAATEVRDTLAVTQGGTVLLWSGQVIDPTTGAATIVQGNLTELGQPDQGDYVLSCGSVPSAPFYVMAALTGALTTVTEPPVNGEPIFEETFTLTACPPSG